MTVASALAVGIMRLRSGQAAQQVRESARADAQLLLGQIMAVDRAWMLAHGDDELSREKLDAFGLLLDERMRGVPIPYLTHSAGFYGREFYVDERVLVPRPESEQVAEAAIARLRKRRGTRALDVGTGSGALALTLALEVSGLRVTATDISRDALAVAARNARALQATELIEFVHCDVYIDRGTPAERFDCIVANLPYVPTAEIPMPPDPVAYEPTVAVDGGADGLTVYRKLAAKLGDLLAPGGSVVFEAAPATIYPLAQLVKDALGGATIEIGIDYAGLERFIVASIA
ncbi:MAG: peptide chain release factor N(5)-glutamine methyltransferase [Vulcanimicrobiaceae bacterium]